MVGASPRDYLDFIRHVIVPALGAPHYEAVGGIIPPPRAGNDPLMVRIRIPDLHPWPRHGECPCAFVTNHCRLRCGSSNQGRTVEPLSQTTLRCLPLHVRRTATQIRCSGRRASGWMTRDDAHHSTGGARDRHAEYQAVAPGRSRAARQAASRHTLAEIAPGASMRPGPAVYDRWHRRVAAMHRIVCAAGAEGGGIWEPGSRRWLRVARGAWQR